MFNFLCYLGWSKSGHTHRKVYYVQVHFRKTIITGKPLEIYDISKKASFHVKAISRFQATGRKQNLLLALENNPQEHKGLMNIKLAITL